MASPPTPFTTDPMASPPPTPFPWEEVASTFGMCAIATWTVSTSAHRALAMRHVLREAGDAPPVVDQRSAMCLPLISSATLLILYFLFSYIQNFLVLYMAFASFGSVSMTLYEPLAVHWSPFVQRMRCGRLSLTRDSASYVAATIAAAVVLTWILTSHWAVLDVLGVCITVSVVSLIRLPSLKVAAIVLVSLFFYDIFWVFLSPYFFESNVMVEVATKKADNPAQAVGEYMNVPGLKDAVATLQLPIKLMFPAGVRNGSPVFHMLGLGDMAIPGIFVAFALTFDKYNEEQQEAAVEDESIEVLLQQGSFVGSSKDVERGVSSVSGATGSDTLSNRSGNGSVQKSSLAFSSASSAATTSSLSASTSAAASPLSSSSSSLLGSAADVSPTASLSSSTSLQTVPKHKPYFRTARLGYVVGIVMSIAASQWFGAAQPALLYLVPAVLTPLLLRARRHGHFALLWKGFQLEGDDEGDEDDEGDKEKGGDGGSGGGDVDGKGKA